MKPDTTTSPSTWPANILAATLFLVPAVGMPNEYVLQDTLKSAIAAFGILLATLAWATDLRKNPRPIQLHWIMLLPLTLCLYALGSMAWSHTYLAGVEAVRWFLVGLAIVLVSNIYSDESELRLLFGMHCGISIAALWVLLQFGLDLQLFPQVAPPASTFANRNFYSEAALCSLPFSMLLLARCKSRLRAAVMGFTTALVITSLLMTGTRSALWTLPLVLSASLFTLWRSLKMQSFGHWPHASYLLPLTVLSLGLFLMGSIPSRNTDIGLGRTAFDVATSRSATASKVLAGLDTSISARQEMWKSAIRMTSANPWSGVGAGAFEVHAVRYQIQYTDDELDPYAHNEYLQLLAEYGMPIGGLVLVLFIAFVVHSAQLLWAPDFSTRVVAPGVVVAALSGLALAALSAVGFPLRLATCNVVFAVSLGVLAYADPSSVEVHLATFHKKLLSWFLWGLLAISGAISLGAICVETQYAKVLHGLNSSTRISPADQARLESSLQWNPHYKKLQLPIVARLVLMQEWLAATTVFEAMTLSRPFSPNSWYSLAMLYVKQDRPDDAQAALNTLQQLQPNTVRNFKVQAEVLYLQGKRADALALVDQLIANWPTQTEMDAGLLRLQSRIRDATDK